MEESISRYIGIFMLSRMEGQVKFEDIKDIKNKKMISESLITGEKYDNL
jgi:hypothetical protein